MTAEQIVLIFLHPDLLHPVHPVLGCVGTFNAPLPAPLFLHSRWVCHGHSTSHLLLVSPLSSSVKPESMSQSKWPPPSHCPHFYLLPWVPAFSLMTSQSDPLPSWNEPPKLRTWLQIPLKFLWDSHFPTSHSQVPSYIPGYLYTGPCLLLSFDSRHVPEHFLVLQPLYSLQFLNQCDLYPCL